MSTKNLETFCPASQKDWRDWLKKNHRSKQSIWLVCYKKNSSMPSLAWTELVDEALCFGWIDSIRKTVDDERFIQFFSKRKAVSTWSKVNKEKVEKLISEKRMTEAGLESINIAKQNGSWSILDSAEAYEIPADLAKAFKTKKGSSDFFISLSKSIQKRMLHWIALAKQEETRRKRILEIAEQAAHKKKPKQF